MTLADWLGWIWLLGIGLCVFVVLLFPIRASALPPLAAGGLGRRGRPGRVGAGQRLRSHDHHGRSVDAEPGRRDRPGRGHLQSDWRLAARLLIAATGLAAVLSLAFRYRHARTAERAQLKWLVYAGVLVVAAILLAEGPVV